MKTYENEPNSNTAPFVDFSLQFSFVDTEKVESQILDILKCIATEIVDGKRTKMGAIVVLGDFSISHQCTEGFVQMKPQKNPIESLIMIGTDEGVEVIKHFSQPPYDGAIAIDRTGQVLGAGLYLIIEHPILEIPDSCGTRHKAAASFSLTDGIIAVLTLSEETGTIRIWKNGSPDKTINI